jgi:4-amino-4-deoxy-L-arabinose transferase and related glycosyltransferases of PMT family
VALVDRLQTACGVLPARVRRLARPRERLLAAVVAVLAGVAVFLLASELFPYHSSNHDEGVYLGQAAALLEGQFRLFPGELAEAVRPWFFVADEGRLYPKYQPLPAGLYAVSMALFGEPRVTLAAVTTGNVALVYTLGAMAFDRRVGLLAAVGFATAPMTLVTSAVFLPYAPTTLFNLAFAVAYLHAHRTGRGASAALAGGAIGVAFLMRPFTAVLFAVPFVGHALWEVGTALRARAGTTGLSGLLRTPAFGRQTITAAVGLVCVAATLAYNTHITGSPLIFPYEAFAPRDGPGFGRRRILEHSVEYSPELAVRTNAAVVWYLLTRWVPAGALGAALAAVGLAASTRVRRLLPGALGAGRSGDDTTGSTARLLLGGLLVTVPVGNVLFWGNFNILANPGDPTDGLLGQFGPFYHFDLLAPVAIFGAAGALALWRARGSVTTPVSELCPTSRAGFGRLGRVVLAAVLLAGLLVTNGALVAGPLAQNAAHTATYEEAYAPFEDREFENAVVFLPTPYGDWLGHPFQYLRNEPGFDGDTVYALDRGPPGNFEVRDAYPNRTHYRYSFRGEWTPDPGEREVTPLLEQQTVRAGPRLAGETTVEVPDRVTHAQVRIETPAGQTTHTDTDPGATLPVTWSVDRTNASLTAVDGESVGASVPVESVGEVVVLVRLVQPAGATLTYRQATTVRATGGGVEALWPPERTVCPLVDDCGREGTYLPDRENQYGLAVESQLEPVTGDGSPGG